MFKVLNEIPNAMENSETWGPVAELVVAFRTNFDGNHLEIVEPPGTEREAVLIGIPVTEPEASVHLPEPTDD